MRVIIICMIIIFVKNTIAAQTPGDESVFFNSTNSADWLKTDKFPEGVFNDSILGITISGKNYVRKDLHTTSFEASALGLFVSPGDMTGRLNYLMSKPFIKKIIFRNTQKTSLLINESVQVPGDRMWLFDGTVMLKGQGIIHGGTISAPGDVQIFDTTITLSDIKVDGNYFPANWFGMVADGATFNDKSLEKAIASAPAGIPVLIPKGSFLIKATLSATRSLLGGGASTIKFNPAHQLAGTVMMQINAGGIAIKNIRFDGSDKALWIMEVKNNTKDVEISNCTISGAAQLEGAKAYAVGIRFREGMDGLHIHDCNFSHINAGITGVARGIIGSGKISPKRVIIENNTFDGITSKGAKNWDADQVVIQDYTDSSGMIIRRNKHYNISKRGQKLQSPGLFSYNNEFRSSRYATENKRSYAAISAYANGTTISGNIVSEGVFEKCIEVGVINSMPFNNIVIQKNKLYLSPSSLGNNDGIRVFGKELINLNISDNYIQNVRKGIWLDCSSNGAIVANNEVRNTTDNAFCINPVSNGWPDTWNYNINVINNKAANVKTYQAFDLWKISGGVISGNSADTVLQSVINKNRVDSLTGNIIIADNKGPGSINYGSTNERPLIKNAAACIGLNYYNTDRKKMERWNGKDWDTAN